MGRRTWIFPDAELPPPGDFPLKGHEAIIVLNMGPEAATVVMTLYFTDRPPVGGPALKVEAGRVRCFRMDRKDDVGVEVPLETQYAIRLESDRPVIVQYGRLDSRQPNLAYYTTMGYSV
jgi:hypothetical protein